MYFVVIIRLSTAFKSHFLGIELLSNRGESYLNERSYGAKF